MPALVISWPDMDLKHYSIWKKGCWPGRGIWNFSFSLLLVLSLSTGFIFQEIKHISAQEFASLISKNDSLNIIDVRTAREFSMGHVPGSVLLDFYKKDFIEKFSALPKSETYYLYCKTGIRSKHAIKLMQSKGYNNLINLDGGWDSLKKVTIKE